MRIRPTLYLLLAFLPAGASLTFAQLISPPPSHGTLEVTEKDEYFETTRFRRLYFRGDFRMVGEPPTEFLLVSRRNDGAAVTFRHEMFRKARIQLWVYREEGPFQFADDVWNQRLGEWMEEAGNRFPAEVEQEFHETENSGPPVLGYISLQSVVSIEDRESPGNWQQRFLIVPVEETGYVLLLSLFAEADRFAYLDSIFAGFLRSLYIPSLEES